MRLALAAALALGCSPVLAQECLTYQQVVTSLEGDGSKIVGAASYSGSLTTEMLIVQTSEVIVMFGFDARGCYIGQIAVEAVAKPGTGA
jgi:hypothetical protein